MVLDESTQQSDLETVIQQKKNFFNGTDKNEETILTLRAGTTSSIFLFENASSVWTT